jgi:hypothetical protein
MSALAQKRQLYRLEYIDLCAYVFGVVNRRFLMNRFDVKEAWATKDFTAYQAKSGDSLVYDHGLKAYKPVEWFTPLFEHSLDDAIQLICEGKQSFLCEPQFAGNAYSYAIKNVKPNLSSIYNVFRALHLSKKVELDYISRTSGKTSRLIAPHSFIRTGCFVYVRGFDHLTGEFRSFKLNRIVNSKLVESKPLDCQTKIADEEWNTDVRVIIKINEKLDNKESIEFDYGLVNGRLETTIKKALLMYFLMDWNIAPQGLGSLPPVLFPLTVESCKDIEN